MQMADYTLVPVPVIFNKGHSNVQVTTDHYEQVSYSDSPLN